MRKQTIRNEKDSKTHGWVKRFDKYFGEKKDARTQELKKYVTEYFDLIPQYSDVYVPRVFVIKNKKSKNTFSCVGLTLGNPTFIPPADYVSLVELLEEPYLVKVLGVIERDVFVQILSPFVHKVDEYTLSKKLLFQNESANEVKNILKSALEVVKPLSDFKGVDDIPSFNEEEIYYEERLKESRVNK
jgi:hypothetical protein